LNKASIALPKRLLRIKRQAARLAELRCMRAAAHLQQLVQAEEATRNRLTEAEASMRERCREFRLIEEVHASRHQIQRITDEIKKLQADIETARADYQSAIAERRKADGEVEVLEKLLERRLDEMHRKLEQRKQQFADEWTMRRWTGNDTVEQEAAQ
jgi:hypothetical protein